MIKIIQIIILLHVSLLSAFAQFEEIRDFNKDGIKDTLRNVHEEDYSFNEYIDGKSHEMFEFKKSNFNKSEFMNFMSVPEVLMRTENESYLALLINKTWNSRIGKPVPSLDWLLDAYQSNHKIKEGYFSQFINVPLQWKHWSSEEPTGALYKVKTDTLNLPNYFYPDTLSKYGLLFYYGHNHINDLGRDSCYNTVYEKKDIKILKTKHGLILRKKKNYAWVFHTDGLLTRGPSKLRWKSLEKILIHKHYIFIHHVSPVMGENRVFVVNIKNGNIGKLNLEVSFSEKYKSCFQMEIQGNKLLLKSGVGNNCEEEYGDEKNMTFKFKKLFKSLKKLNKNK